MAFNPNTEQYKNKDGSCEVEACLVCPHHSNIKAISTQGGLCPLHGNWSGFATCPGCLPTPVESVSKEKHPTGKKLEEQEGKCSSCITYNGTTVCTKEEGWEEDQGLTVGEVLRWQNKHELLASEGAKIVHIRQLLAKARKEVVEEVLEKLKKLPVGSFDSTPYLEEFIAKLKEDIK